MNLVKKRNVAYCYVKGMSLWCTAMEETNCIYGIYPNKTVKASSTSAYVAVKRFVKVETVIIPQGKFTAVEGTPLEYVDKKKIINQTGQEVIVMDSKWFRKIINDNDIYVRGFWRMQNKKNDEGEWYKELIFVDSFVRHGYHRNAKIEDETER